MEETNRTATLVFWQLAPERSITEAVTSSKKARRIISVLSRSCEPGNERCMLRGNDLVELLQRIHDMQWTLRKSKSCRSPGQPLHTDMHWILRSRVCKVNMSAMFAPSCLVDWSKRHKKIDLCRICAVGPCPLCGGRLLCGYIVAIAALRPDLPPVCRRESTTFQFQFTADVEEQMATLQQGQRRIRLIQVK